MANQQLALTEAYLSRYKELVKPKLPIIKSLLLNGKSKKYISQYLGLTLAQFNTFINNIPELKSLMDYHKDIAIAKVEQSLFNSCHDRKITKTKVVINKDGSKTIIKEEQVLPASTRAQEIVLKYNTTKYSSVQVDSTQESLDEICKAFTNGIDNIIKKGE